MNQCPACNVTRINGQESCLNCGWLFKEAHSHYAKALLEQKVKLWTRFVPKPEVTQNKIQELNTVLEGLQKDIDSLNDKITETNEHYSAIQIQIKKEKASKKEKAQLLSKLEVIDQRLKGFDNFINAYKHPKGVERINCEFIKNVLDIEGINLDQLPSLVLLIGKKQLFGTTKNVDYSILLDKYVQSKGKNRWQCTIPNHLNFRGQYYGLVSGLHRPPEERIQINCINDEIYFL